MKRTYLLDSNVIYSYTLRDYFLTLAIGGLEVHWSTEIEAEFIRARERKSREQAIKAREVVKLMRSAVPDWRAFASPARIASLTLPDADDRHVLAAAIQIGADVIVTNNLGDFPQAALAPHGIVASTPDQALCDLHDEDADRIIRAAADMRARMVSPPLTPEQWLERLEKAGARALAGRLRPFASML